MYYSTEISGCGFNTTFHKGLLIWAKHELLHDVLVNAFLKQEMQKSCDGARTSRKGVNFISFTWHSSRFRHKLLIQSYQYSSFFQCSLESTLKYQFGTKNYFNWMFPLLFQKQRSHCTLKKWQLNFMPSSLALVRSISPGRNKNFLDWYMPSHQKM